jgi:predicted RNA binding protein YcfA (HicA-like mRNA interferase family)
MLPVIKGRDLILLLQSIGFEIIRTKGSHVRMKCSDGRVTTVPLHGSEDIPKGLLRKIIREDLEMTLDEFCTLYQQNRK